MSLINRSNIGLKEEVTIMSTTQNATVESNIRPEYDDEIQKIADYVLNYSIDNDSPNSADAWNTARHCLMDTLGCGPIVMRQTLVAVSHGRQVMPPVVRYAWSISPAAAKWASREL